MNPEVAANPDTYAGQAIYDDAVLRFYDFFVLGLSNHLIWRCPTRHILDLYNRHASDRHLDVGVGSGYFLDHCRFPSPAPRITLLDLNASSLAYSARRIERYRPEILRADVLQPIHLEPRAFDSIGLSYLIHCLPGDMAAKAKAFLHLAPLLSDKGVLFGATILGQGVPHDFLSRTMMGIYNSKGIFGNAGDSEAGLRAAILRAFGQADIQIIGCTALFAARAPRRMVRP